MQTTSIFVPVEITITITNSTEMNFTKKELDFLKKKSKCNNEYFICGEKVWELFCDIIENRHPDFTTQKAQIVIMQGLVSKFSFSINTYSKTFLNIKENGSGFEQYGFYKLVHNKEVYDYKTGIKNKELDSAIIF